MKTFSKILALTFASTTLLGCASMQSATPLELRMMQTRQFDKAPREIVDAIKTNCGDYGGEARLSMPWNIADTQTKANVKSKNASVVNKDQSLNGEGVCTLPLKTDATAGGKAFIPYIGGLIAMAELNEAMKNASRMTYDVKTDAKMTYTLVRMRIYNANGEQMTDPKVYSEWFSKIGDAVHIQAIPISATTQQ